MKKTIFISYSWNNTSIADEIEVAFDSDFVDIKRDKRDLKYKDTIKEFMKSIRSTDYVIMLLSDAYLKSSSCMYEVLETLRDDNYLDRIFPIVLPEINIYSPKAKLEYLKYWDEEYHSLKIEISKFSPDKVIDITKDLKILKNISNSIIGFISEISDRNLIEYHILKETNFMDIKQKIGIPFESNSAEQDEKTEQTIFNHIDISSHTSNIRYEILKQEDVSHSGAKRYSAKVLIESKYSRLEVKSAIKEVVESLINSNYYKNDSFKQHFDNRKADVVWIFVANKLSDVNNTNWICRACWINSELNPAMRPIQIDGNDSIDDIQIEWNEKYDELSKFYDEHLTTKDNYLSLHDQVIIKNQVIISPLIDLFNLTLNQNNGTNTVTEYIEKHEIEINTIFNEANRLPFAPNDCRKLANLTQEYFANSLNLFLFYAPKGLETWNENSRLYLMKQNITKVNELYKQIIDERKIV